jgi:TonB family protein
MKNISLVAMMITCGMFLSGCATVMKGSNQSIAIATPPATGANCALSSKEGTWYVVSPGVVRVEKSEDAITVRCTKPGWQDASRVIPSDFQGWTVGNVFIGGVIGVGVDMASGAIHEYPHAFNVPMAPDPTNAAAVQEAASAPALPANGPPHVDTSGVNMQPNYPASALAAHEKGSAIISVSVRDDGTVGKASLARSSGYSDLDSAAINAVLHWKFQPALENGEPVDGETSVLIAFQPPT